MANTVVPGDKSTKQAIDQFNREMRGQPWYQEFFQKQGLDPNHVKLSKDQREQLEQLALANGAPPDAFDDMMIDPAGNLNTEHGFASLPTWAKVTIGAGVAAGGFFAAPAVGSTLGIGGGGATGSSTAAGMTGMGVTPSLAGSTAALGGSAAGGAGAFGTAGATAALTGGGGAIVNAVKGAATNPSTMNRIGALVGKGAEGIAGATEAAARNRAVESSQGLTANAQNIAGEQAFQGQQVSMAKLEAEQQEAARKNLYRASVAKNPQVSVENPRGAPSFSPEMLEGLTNLEKQALLRTAEAPQYSTGQMRKPRDYQPYAPTTAAPASTMERVGGWLAPALSLANLGLEMF